MKENETQGVLFWSGTYQRTVGSKCSKPRNIAFTQIVNIIVASNAYVASSLLHMGEITGTNGTRWCASSRTSVVPTSPLLSSSTSNVSVMLVDILTRWLARGLARGVDRGVARGLYAEKFWRGERASM